ncbi:MAG: guanosine-3',5'-bis(diphosphate) 3'-pyrophosphohydrolase [Myxococcota bacterium]|jgi:guanosine-3',5'-bis(diphosphate) 3'-pyrophosphohydrolase
MIAADFAARAHRDHRRKGAHKAPYVNHLIDVCRVLTETGGVSESSVLCAAMLHDVVEDTPVTIEEVRTAFGDAVADLVAEVTDDKSLPKAVRKQHQVDHAAHLSPGACLIKIADKISNIRDFLIDAPPWEESRYLGYIDWSVRVVEKLPHRNTSLDELFDEICTQARAAV